MSGIFRLDPGDMRRPGTELSGLGDRVSHTYAQLRDALARAEGCWGDDEMGNEFAKDFKPNSEAVLTYLRAMADSLHDAGEGIVEATRRIEAGDQHAADLIGSTAEGLSRPQFAGAPGSYRSADAARMLPEPGGPSPMWGVPHGDAVHSAGQSPPVAPPAVAAGDLSAPKDDTQQSKPKPTAGGPGIDRSGDQDARRSDPRAASTSSSSRPVMTPGVRPPDPNLRPAAAARPRITSWIPAGASAPDRPAAVVPGPGSRPSGGPGDRVSRPADPQAGSPPRTAQPTARPSDGRDRDRPHKQGAGMLQWLARTLADRHGVEVLGFDLPGLEESVIREFAAAVDRVLIEYPAVDLDVVEVADLGGAGRVRWNRGPRGNLSTAAVRSITLDEQTARNPEPAAGTSESAMEPAAIYAATARELARALDFAGGGIARKRAQRALIAEYLRLQAGRHHTLAEVVGGYRNWRAAVVGTNSGTTRFDPSRALCEAFADVVIHGAGASVQARTLHRVLVEAAADRE